MLVLVAVILLSRGGGRMPHDQGYVVHALPLVDRPLTESAPALPVIELHLEIVLDHTLQRADPPVRDVSAVVLDRREEGILGLPGSPQTDPPGLEILLKGRSTVRMDGNPTGVAVCSFSLDMLGEDLVAVLRLVHVAEREHAELLGSEPRAYGQTDQPVCLHELPIPDIDLGGPVKNRLDLLFFQRSSALLVPLGIMRGILDLELEDGVVVEVHQHLDQDAEILVDGGCLDSLTPVSDEHVDVLGGYLPGIVCADLPLGLQLVEDRGDLPQTPAVGRDRLGRQMAHFSGQVFVYAFCERISSHFLLTLRNTGTFGF